MEALTGIEPALNGFAERRLYQLGYTAVRNKKLDPEHVQSKPSDRSSLIWPPPNADPNTSGH